MKLLKMRIRRNKKEGRTHYDYPTPYYDAMKVIFGPIYEGGLNEIVQSDIVPRNANDEFILIGINNNDFNEFMKADGFEKDGFKYEVKEVNRIKTLKMGNKWTKQVEKITDQNKVLGVLAKVARKEKLTEEEENAIDPEKEEVGINKTASFEKSLDKFLEQ